jgi:alanyl-tRNA synthetase
MKVLSKRVDVETPAALRDLADRFKEKLKSGIVVLGSVVGAKALLVAVVSKDLTHQYHAGNIVKQISAIVGGRGGGRSDMAQAGGTRPENLDQALEKVYELF